MTLSHDELQALARRSHWAMLCVIAGGLLGLYWLFTDNGDVTPAAGWLAIVAVIVGVILQPGDDAMGDHKAEIEELASDGLGHFLGKAAKVALVWGLILYGASIYDWTAEKAGQAYDAGADAVASAADLLQSDEERATSLTTEVGAKLAKQGATAKRLTVESKLAADLAKIADTPEARQRAVDAYGRAATTASSRNDLDALQRMIDAQIALDRKGGTR